MVATAFAFFWKARKAEQERVVTFAKPRYRNGVEVKPSEAFKAQKNALQKEKLLVKDVEEDQDEGEEEEEVLDTVVIN